MSPAAISYIVQRGDHSQLMKLETATGTSTPIMPLPDDIQQVAWLDDGSLLAGQGTKLVRARPGDDWHALIDLGLGLGLGTIQRVVVAPDRKHVAIVVKK